MIKTIAIITTFCLFIISNIFASDMKRDCGDNLYKVISANTLGIGNLWLEGNGIGFIWDNDGKLKLFPEIEVRYGILNFLQAKVNSRILSYGFKPGFIAGEIKVTMPNNKRIRFWGPGLSLRYEYGLLSDIKGSIGGYRDPVGATGFFAEGFLFQKGTTDIILANDIEFITISSYLPITLYVNAGISMANDKKFSEFDRSLFGLGIEYKGVSVDFYTEFTLKAFNNSTVPLVISDLPVGKKYMLYFRENEMYVTPGARIRYAGGLCISGRASILLSKNVGSSLDDKVRFYYPQEEKDAGITDGFSPFFAGWMLSGSLSYPLRYKKPAAELYREFLLKKNENKKRVIDLEENLKNEDKGTQDSQDEKKRLKEIEDRKKKVMDESIIN